MKNPNTLLCTDLYKVGHMLQYPDDISHVFSYMQTRSNKKYSHVVFFGLQYYLKKYLEHAPTHADVEEFLKVVTSMLLLPVNQQQKIRRNLHKVAELGYWPIEIYAVPEGSIVSNPNLLMTIENTVPGFGWVVGFLESLLLKVWNTCTVATYSYELKELCKRYQRLTSPDSDEFLEYQVHDFGHRGCSSEETAALSGAAHLLNFNGTDTIAAVNLLHKYYVKPPNFVIGTSVPATEHSVMCSFGPGDGELEAVRHILKLYPTGIVSIVADTYDFFGFLKKVRENFYHEIMSRDGKVVFRPDSGDPIKILLGDVDAVRERIGPGMPIEDLLPHEMGAIEYMHNLWGSTVNNTGFLGLNPKVGLIYGDGMTYARIEEILSRLAIKSYKTDCIVFGVGGLLLQQHNRDDMGFTFKASHITKYNGETIDLIKDPVTDPGKRSLSGIVSIYKDHRTYEWYTEKVGIESSKIVPADDQLVLFYKNGSIWERSLHQIKHNLAMNSQMDL